MFWQIVAWVIVIAVIWGLISELRGHLSRYWRGR